MAHPTPEIPKVTPPPPSPGLGLDITKGQGTGKMCSLYGGLVLSRLFFIYLSRYMKIYRGGLLYGDSSVIIRVLGVESFFVNYCLLSLSKKPTFCDITTGFPAKRRLKKRAWKFHTDDASLLIG